MCKHCRPVEEHHLAAVKQSIYCNYTSMNDLQAMTIECKLGQFFFIGRSKCIAQFDLTKFTLKVRHWWGDIQGTGHG
jgi:hypothetical protein